MRRTLSVRSVTSVASLFVLVGAACGGSPEPSSDPDPNEDIASESSAITGGHVYSKDGGRTWRIWYDNGNGTVSSTPLSAMACGTTAYFRSPPVTTLTKKDAIFFAEQNVTGTAAYKAFVAACQSNTSATNNGVTLGVSPYVAIGNALVTTLPALVQDPTSVIGVSKGVWANVTMEYTCNCNVNDDKCPRDPNSKGRQAIDDNKTLYSAVAPATLGFSANASVITRDDTDQTFATGRTNVTQSFVTACENVKGTPFALNFERENYPFTVSYAGVPFCCYNPPAQASLGDGSGSGGGIGSTSASLGDGSGSGGGIGSTSASLGDGSGSGGGIGSGAGSGSSFSSASSGTTPTPSCPGETCASPGSQQCVDDEQGSGSSIVQVCSTSGCWYSVTSCGAGCVAGNNVIVPEANCVEGAGSGAGAGSGSASP